ncbi:MAG: hypothetical protein A4S09_07235 [Proteobacteria bacterium SG_bin7]|nr:MAG: hypothetical protein A4S09_07235 [Proteobacteria bacterium SG_bin7]
MKPLTISELELLAEDLHFFVGGQVQKVTGTLNEFGLGVWKNSQTHWLWVVLDKKNPLFLVTEGLPAHKKKTTPVLLFLNAHVNEKVLRAVKFERNLGRVLKLEFDDAEIELRLFPHGLNFIVKSGKRQVAWTKIQELSVSQNQETFEGQEEIRTPKKLFFEWSTSKGVVQKKDDPELNVEAWRKKEKLKLEKSLLKLREDIDLKKKLLWREAGEVLKRENALSSAEKFKNYFDKKKSLSWNIENCFSKAKDTEEKIKRAALRERELLSSIAGIDQKVPTKKTENLVSKEKIPQRSLKLSESVSASFGKSAVDNLKLLRNAKPWQLWLHLKDYPAAHCIVSFARGKSVSDEEVRQIASWLISETQIAGKNKKTGGKFEVLITECRFVTPIKGDSLGRVIYRNERVFTIRVD